MLKRLIVVAAAAAGFFALGSAARASTVSDEIAAHRAQVEAKIACDRAQIEGRPCGTSSPAAAPAAASTSSAPASGGAKSIEISLSRQELIARQGNSVVLETPVSTGAPGHETPVGRFSIQTKETMHWSTKFDVWMPYAMQVVGDIFIHELPITPSGQRIGASQLGTPVSHGCIRVGIGPARWLFDWADIGTPVWIH